MAIAAEGGRVVDPAVERDERRRRRSTASAAVDAAPPRSGRARPSPRPSWPRPRARTSSQTGSRTRSRRSASRTSGAGAGVTVAPSRWPSPSLVVPQEQLLQGRRLAGQRARPRARLSRPAAPSSWRCRPRRRRGARTTSGRAPRAGAPGRSARPASSASIEVRVRWRRSASVPVSTVRPARMMLTRSHSASTSARMWLDSSTVRPLAAPPRCSRGTPPPSAGPAPRSARPGSAARRRRRARRPGRPSAGCPWSRCAPFLRRVQLEPLQQLGARRWVEAAAQPAEQVDDLAAGQVRPEVDVAGHVGEPPVQRGGVAPGVAAEQRAPCRRPRAAARAGSGSWWTSRRRWGRGSRAPPPWRR